MIARPRGRAAHSFVHVILTLYQRKGNKTDRNPLYFLWNKYRPPKKMYPNQTLFTKCILFSTHYIMQSVHKGIYFMQIIH